MNYYSQNPTLVAKFCFLNHNHHIYKRPSSSEYIADFFNQKVALVGVVMDRDPNAYS
jgi:hypothetical protein